MMSDAYTFSEQLEFGLEWEEWASDNLASLLQSISIENISYSEYPDIQRAGVDSILSKQTPAIDIKTQSYKYTKTGNLPIETMSVEEDGKPGWFYTSDADLIVWVYPNKPETNLHHTAYFMPHTEGLKEWFDDRIEEFRRVQIPNDGDYGQYTTVVRLVPIADFPPEYLVSFDPRLPTDRETPQSDLTEWLD